MSLAEFVLYWFLPVVGLVYVLGYSVIFQPVRNAERTPRFLRTLLDCPMCISFWMGILVGLANAIPVAWPRWVQLPLVGAVSAIGIQYIIELLARRRHR